MTYDKSGSPQKLIHYLGSKKRLTDPIKQAILSARQGSGPVIDLFAGTGVITHALLSEVDVIASDIQAYSTVLVDAVLNLKHDEILNARQQILSKYDALLDEFAPIIAWERKVLKLAAEGRSDLLVEFSNAVSLEWEMQSGTSAKFYQSKFPTVYSAVATRLRPFICTRYYAGVYFSFEQAALIDAVCVTARERIPQRNPLLSVALILASELVSSVGKQFAQPIRPARRDGSVKPHAVRQLVANRLVNPLPVLEKSVSRLLSAGSESTRKGVATVIRSDFRELLARDITPSAIYADPPYTRDHYSRFYHVLETLALGDEPQITKSNLNGGIALSRAVYRADRHQSPFSIKSQASEAFKLLISRSADLDSSLIISYSPIENANSHPRAVSINKIVEIGSQYFSNIQIQSLGEFRHSKLNKKALHKEASSAGELLVTMSQ